MVERSFLIVEMLAGILCLHGLFGKKFKWNIYTVVYLSVEFIFYQIGLEYGSVEKLKIALYILLFVYTRIQFKGSWRISIFNYIMCIIVCSILQLIASIPVELIGFKKYPINYFIVNILFFIIVIIFYQNGFLNKIAQYIQQKGRMVVAILLALISFLVVAMYMFAVNGGFEIWSYYLLMGSVIMLFFLLYYLQKERMRNKQMEAEINLNNLYGNALSELIERVRMNQHDYKNQLATIQGMAYTAQSIEELRVEQEKYYQIIGKEDKYYKIISGNDDPMIAGFLYSKLCNVDMENIQVDCSLKISKIENILLASDIVKVLGILIDNAFEEISKEEYEKKGIDIEVNESEDLKIKVGNVCHFMSISEMEKCFKKGHSSKGEGRGLGLYNVSEIIRRWKGTILPENIERGEENWFYITVELPKRKRP